MAIHSKFFIKDITNEFFEQYKELFFRITEYLDTDTNSKNILGSAGTDIPRFTNKLLRQIVFLYFLQKKGWLGVHKNEKWGSGQKNFLQSIFKKSDSEGKNFFNSYLRFLFYEAFAHQHGEDNYYEKLDCRIPFLNNGLFEADYDWENFEINLPNTLFHNNEKLIKTGDVGTGILDIFNRYIFTIREDEQLEKEVSIDPEMLGKVFENMLEITERKSKGAFYTPREIVHYMCQESLVEYLATSCNQISRDIIERLIKKQLDQKDADLVKQHVAEIYDALEKVKICDPAIGSGAFSMGMLQEIFSIKQTLHLFEYGSLDTFRASEVKLNIIQNSIYGVDIEKDAVEIARLRLWLSLIIDEELPKPLPNLDYKIVEGNSLVSKFEDEVIDIDWSFDVVSQDLFGTELEKNRIKLLKDISEKQKIFFSPKCNKKQLSLEIRNLKIDLLINWKQHIQKLQNLKNHPEQPLRFFDWKINFPEIMNPMLAQKMVGINGTQWYSFTKRLSCYLR